LQLAVEVDDTAGSVTLRADDVEVVSASGVDNRPAGGIQFFTMGIDWSAGNQEAGGVWIDDVMLDDSPVSCL
jgi:hypothetical protein